MTHSDAASSIKLSAGQELSLVKNDSEMHRKQTWVVPSINALSDAGATRPCRNEQGIALQE